MIMAMGIVIVNFIIGFSCLNPNLAILQPGNGMKELKMLCFYLD
jgi:hypothetical protein